MKFKLNKPQIIGVVSSLIIIIASMIFLYFRYIEERLFYLIFGISFMIAGLPFFMYLILETKEEREKEEMFLEFARDLVESVKAGTPISKSIINIENKDYRKLSPYVKKLANQISLGISIKTALETFSRDVQNNTISRAVSIISESEKAGGNIEEVLESVAKSVSQIEKLKKERRTSMYNLIIQGYIIFFIFIVIMLVMQFKILPIASGLTESMEGMEGGAGGISAITGIGVGGGASAEELTRPFVWLLITQGFFIGLIIGKLAEDSIRAGLKHSFVLVVLALLIDSGAKFFLG